MRYTGLSVLGVLGDTHHLLSVDQLLGEAIKRIHRNESVSKLFR